MPIGRVFHLEEIQEAHRVMEANTAGGKIVVVHVVDFVGTKLSSPRGAPRRATSPAG